MKSVPHPLCVVVSAVLLSAAISAAAPSSAFAQAPTAKERFNTVVKEGMRAYQAKDFNRAIERFERAYAIRPEPEMVFNVARSHEKALHLDEAIVTYERFLKLEGTTAALRARARKSLLALRAEKQALAEGRRAQAAPPPPVAPPPRVAPRPPPRSRPPMVSRPTEANPPDRTLEWSLLGGGLAVAATGAVFAGLAVSARNDYDSERDRGALADVNALQSARDDVERNALIADILIPVGVVAATVGLSLFVIRSGDDDDGFVLNVNPSLNPQAPGVALSGAF